MKVRIHVIYAGNEYTTVDEASDILTATTSLASVAHITGLQRIVLDFELYAKDTLEPVAD